MSDLVEVKLPSDLPEGTRSQVLGWLKNVGDPVSENEPLLEIETDKVTVEIPSPCSGTVLEILVQAQAEVDLDAVLGRIDRSASARLTPEPGPVHAPVGKADEAAAARTQPTAPAANSLSPAVRRLLAENQLEPADITGSGPNGKITIGDILSHLGGKHPGTRVERATPGAPAPSASKGHLVPHSRMRVQIAERMVASLLHTAPHVTSLFEVDLSAVMAHRAQWRTDFQNRGVPLTLTAYFLAACVDALKAVPELNSRWHPEGLEMHERIDIGIATALANGGLVVPIVRNVAALDLFVIARELADLVAKAREDRLVPAEVRGGTFTISNHGVSGSLLAAPIIINQPQSAILGIGKVEKRAVVTAENGRDVVSIAPRCYVTLTIDHRVVDGQRANEFLTVLSRRLESWER